MNFRQHNALSFSIENILRDDFPRRTERPDSVVDAQTQTSFENIPNTVMGHRCALCRQLLTNTNEANEINIDHSADETIRHRDVKGTVLFFLNLQLVHVSTSVHYRVVVHDCLFGEHTRSSPSAKRFGNAITAHYYCYAFHDDIGFFFNCYFYRAFRINEFTEQPSSK